MDKPYNGDTYSKDNAKNFGSFKSNQISSACISVNNLNSDVV